MREGRERLLVAPDARYADALVEVYQAANRAPEPLRAGVEALVDIAELLDPADAREGLWRLQTDCKTLTLVEPYVGGEPTQAALRIGAAIHLARAELASPEPRLRRRLPEILEWLGQRQLSAVE